MASILSPLYRVYDWFQNFRGINNTFLSEQHISGTDLTGKWIIISGSNNGVGYEAAKSFAAWGANLILACREPPTWELHPTAAVKECKDLAEAGGHSSTIEWWEIDMADLNSIEVFCRRWLKSDRALDILCNNAGLAAVANNGSIMTTDGFQLVHQVRLVLTLIPEPKLKCLGQLPIPRPTNPSTSPISSPQCRTSYHLHNVMPPPPRILRPGPLQRWSRDERRSVC